MIRLKWWERLLTRAVDAALAMLAPLRSEPTPAAAPGAAPDSILVVEIWRTGDVILSTTVLEPLARRYPNARIVLLSSPVAPALVAGSPHLAEIVTFDFPWTAEHGKYALWRWPWRRLAALVGGLRARRFSLCLDARGDLRNNLLTWLIGAGERLGYATTGGGRLLTHVVSAPDGVIHRVDAWRRLLVALGIPAAAAAPRLPVTADEDRTARALLAAHGCGPATTVVAIHPGARVALRRWDIGRFAAVGRDCLAVPGVRVVVIVDPDGTGRELAQTLDVPALELDLRGLIALLGHVSLLVCNESGPMHIAVSRGTRVVSIFGPGEPEYFGPSDPRDRVVIETPMPCRPCLDRCLFAEPYCMTRIEPERVMEAVRASLAAGASSPA